MKFHLALFSLTLKGQSRSHWFSMAYISKSIKDTTELITIGDGQEVIYNMRFHLEQLSLTLSDLERSIQVTQVFNGLYLQIRSR